MNASLKLGGGHYTVGKSTSGQVVLRQVDGANIRWFESESEYRAWLRAGR